MIVGQYWMLGDDIMKCYAHLKTKLKFLGGKQAQ